MQERRAAGADRPGALQRHEEMLRLVELDLVAGVRRDRIGERVAGIRNIRDAFARRDLVDAVACRRRRSLVRCCHGAQSSIVGRRHMSLISARTSFVVGS